MVDRIVVHAFMPFHSHYRFRPLFLTPCLADMPIAYYRCLSLMFDLMQISEQERRREGMERREQGGWIEHPGEEK